MATRDDSEMVGTALPPLENYNKAFSYGFFLERPDERITMDQLTNDPERYIELVLNPQQLTWREPVATKVRITQGGGKVIESRGGVIKHGTVSGTTGYLPTTSPEVSTAAAVSTQPQRSGYADFYKLRRLFRIFMEERRLKGTDAIKMHFMDYKADEFWLIEPSEFQMPRTSKRPLLYSYNITFDAIEPSYSPKLLVSVTQDDPTALEGGVDAAVDSLTRTNSGGIAGQETAGGSAMQRRAVRAQYVNRLQQIHQMAASWTAKTSGVVKQSFQGAMAWIDGAIGILNLPGDFAGVVVTTAITCLKQLSTSIQGGFDAVDRYAEENIKMEANAYWLELRRINDQLQVMVDSQLVNTAGSKFAAANARYTEQRGTAGNQSQAVEEPEDSDGQFSVNPLLGRAGLGLVSDIQALQQLSTVSPEIIMDGEDIYSLAQRLLGSSMRFMELVVLNDLEAPYIFNDPMAKPPNTLAWGESILVPALKTKPVEVDSTAPEPSIESYSGAFTDVVGLVLEDAEMAFRPGALIGMTLTVTSGPAFTSGDNQRIVVDNTETTVTVGRDWSDAPSAGDTYTLHLETFTLRRTVSPEVAAFGRDLLAVPVNDGAGQIRYNLALNALNDLAMVEGEECLFQRLAILMGLERGTHPIHKQVGVPRPLGRKVDSSRLLLYSYFARQTLLGDPSVARVINPRFVQAGDTMSFQAEVQPVRIKGAKFFQHAF